MGCRHHARAMVAQRVFGQGYTLTLPFTKQPRALIICQRVSYMNRMDEDRAQIGAFYRMDSWQYTDPGRRKKSKKIQNHAEPSLKINPGNTCRNPAPNTGGGTGLLALGSTSQGVARRPPSHAVVAVDDAVMDAANGCFAAAPPPAAEYTRQEKVANIF